MKAGFLDKLVEKLNKLDPQNLQAQFLRLSQEEGLLETVFNALRLLETIFNALHDGIIVLDPDGSITYVNSAATSMLGFTIDAAHQQHISKYLKEIEWQKILNMEEQEWSKLISHEIEITYPKKRFLNMYITPISLNAGKSKGAVVILRDITSDREKEIKTLKSERLNAVTFLAAGVAHEIGNPLNSLHIHLQLLERELDRLPADNRKSVEDLVKISRGEVERLNMIITQFLKAIRPAVPRRQPCRIEEVLAETVDFMKHEIENRDVIVEVKTPEPVPVISADRNQIKQAFFNIIKNALHAMRKGGILTTTIFSNDRFLGVSFKDDGEGMPAEQLGRLFKPYQSTKADGSGLGLFIVQRIVQDHGGEIEVYSRPKAGTVFTMFLPLNERRLRLLKAPRKQRSSKNALKQANNE